MHELSLMCPEERVEDVSDALDALDALSVSVEDMDAQTDAEQALFGEPGMPAPKKAGTAAALLGLFPDEAAARQAQTLLQVQDFFEEKLPSAGYSSAGAARLGAVNAITISACGYHPRVLDCAHLA